MTCNWIKTPFMVTWNVTCNKFGILWGLVTQLESDILINISSGNGLSPVTLSQCWLIDNWTFWTNWSEILHYCDVIMGAIASQNHQPHDCLLNRLFRHRSKKKHKSSASLAFVRGIHRWPVNSSHKGPVTRKIFLFDDVIMLSMCKHGLSWESS